MDDELARLRKLDCLHSQLIANLKRQLELERGLQAELLNVLETVSNATPAHARAGVSDFIARQRKRLAG